MTNGLGREIGLLRVVAQNLVSRPAPETQITQEYLRVPDGSATCKAIEYSLGRGAALVRYPTTAICL